MKSVIDFMSNTLFGNYREGPTQPMRTEHLPPVTLTAEQQEALRQARSVSESLELVMARVEVLRASVEADEFR